MITNIQKALEDNEINYDTHCSDIYVPVSILTASIVSDYEYKQNVTVFTCELTGVKHYEIPFSYNDYRK